MVDRSRFLERIPGCNLGAEKAKIPPRPRAVRGVTTGLCKNIGIDATMAKCGVSMAELMISEARIEKVKGARVQSGDIVAALNTTIAQTNHLVNRKPLHDTIRTAATRLEKHAKTVRNRLEKKEGVIPRTELPELRKEFVKIQRKVQKLHKAVSGYCGNGPEMSARVPRRKPKPRKPGKRRKPRKARR